MSEESEKKSRLGVLKEAGGLSVVLYVFGFLSLRSWLNLLGVWSAPPLIDQTYLAEGGAFFVATAEKLIFPWGFLGLVVMLVWVVVRARGKQQSRSDGGAPTPEGDRPPRSTPRWQLPTAVAIAVGLTLLVRTLLLDELSKPDAILLTHVCADADPSHYQWCVGIVGAVGVGWVVLWRRVIDLGRGHAALQHYLFALGCLGACLLPMNFARTAKERVAPVAHFKRATETTPPFFLLLQTEKELVVYDGTTIRTLAREGADEIEIDCHATLQARPHCPARDSAGCYGTGAANSDGGSG